jgi:phenylpropionate dioxygenase-like ring-hydroxylating dioxygenase large terminal subunit
LSSPERIEALSDLWPSAVRDTWHPVAYAHAVRGKPLATLLMGRALVVYRYSTGIAVLDDRCPHRNVRLSRGCVKGNTIVCPYHGWEFSPDGQCAKVPGSADNSAIAARSYPVMVKDGLVWTTLAETPPPFPALPGEIGDAAYDSYWWPVKGSTAHLADAIENLLDPMHSYFLHPGLVRASRTPNAMQVDLTLAPWGCEARYTENRATMTWLQRVSEGDRTHSYGRYFAPTIVQIAFEDTKGLTIAITVILAPEDHDQTRPYAHFATRKGIMPAWLKRGLITAFNLPILFQDRAALADQARNAARFGGPDYAIGPVDFFGPTIWRLLNGKPQAEEQKTFQITP